MLGRTNTGGAALNFDVKQYDSEAQLLAATPKKNTIGIISDTKMTGWVIDVNQPDNPTEGLVWICTGTSSTIEFNALKRNGIQVYLISAKQYVSGVWANVAASVYQDSAWTNFSYARHYIFQSGSGFSVDCVYGSGTKAEITVSNSNITAKMNADTGAIESYLRTKNKIDVTPYSTMYMECIYEPYSDKYDNSDTSWDMGFGLSSLAFTHDNVPGNAYTTDALNVALKVPTKTSTKKTFNLDISRKSGIYYVGFWGSANATIYNIWLE